MQSARTVRRWLVSVAVLASCVASNAAFADVPGRVGRIGYLQGDVQFYAESDPTWRAAYVNQPVTSRNSIFVGDGGRVEIGVGSTTLALDSGSQVDVQQLDDNQFDVNVVRGRASFTVRRVDPADRYTAAVPGAEFALLRPGRYRVDALPEASGLTVFNGQGSFESGNGPVLVNAGSAMVALRDAGNPAAPPSFQSVASRPTAIDDWVAAREARFQNSQSARFVSTDMTGYEELDANGRWATEADLGPVWYPTTYVSADWVPYRHGRWAYVAPWGYTWIDDAPWGFAPFHYGRWVQVGGRWGWCPGAYVARPVYAPALVGFYGGNDVALSFSVGSGPAVGWYPLAPWQRYSPHYTSNVTYVNRVNNITIVNPPPRFAGRDGGDWNRFHGGTVVPQAAFASQRGLGRVAMAPPRDFVDRASTVNAGSLPRPVPVAAAVREGPRNDGVERPGFARPRDFARQPPAVEARVQGIAQQPTNNPAMEQRRLEIDQRPPPRANPSPEERALLGSQPTNNPAMEQRRLEIDQRQQQRQERRASDARPDASVQPANNAATEQRRAEFEQRRQQDAQRQQQFEQMRQQREAQQAQQAQQVQQMQQMQQAQQRAHQEEAARRAQQQPPQEMRQVQRPPQAPQPAPAIERPAAPPPPRQVNEVTRQKMEAAGGERPGRDR